MIRRIIGGLIWGSILAILSRFPTPRSKAEVRKRTWLARLMEAAALFGTLGVIGIAVVVSGLIPIKASSGHWPITRWFLEFSMERAFSTQSMGIEAPPLNDRGLVLRGATQYETTCRPCHGAPDLRAPRVAAAMMPTPPYLPPVINHWKPAELFSIVKHGVKFTGMPGWPSRNRDDEVWAMVAFLQVLPSLSADEYRRLASGPVIDAASPAAIEGLTAAERCARCHGVDGRGRGGAFPKLAGQHAPYLYNALRAYQSGRRASGIMEPVAAGLSDAEMRGLARYYADLPPALGANATPLARGRDIAHHGIPSQKVPPCAECHGPAQSNPRREYPLLGGQDAWYIVLQLELFKSGHRGGSQFAHLMEEVAPNLTPQQMRDVAVYYESLRP